MGPAETSSPYFPLTPENEKRALNAVDATPYARDACSATLQAIGQALSIPTAEATPIFMDLYMRKRIEIVNDPAANINKLEPDFQQGPPAKFARTTNTAA